jgi:hypothetical protein
MRLLRKLYDRRFIVLGICFSCRFQQQNARGHEPRRDIKPVNNKPIVKKVPDNKQKQVDNKRVNNPVGLFDFL